MWWLVLENWETESYPAAWDLRYILLFSLFFPALRFVLDNFVFEKVGRYYIFRKARIIYGKDGSKQHSTSSSNNSSHNSASSSARSSNSSGIEEKSSRISSSSSSRTSRSSCGDGSASQPLLATAGVQNGDVKTNTEAAAIETAAAGEDVSATAAAAALSSKEAEMAALEKVHIKFKESCWKSIYYFSAEVFAVAVSVGEPWLEDTRYYWVGPGDQVWPDQTMKLKLKALYMFVGGFYTYSIFALVFWETRRKDFGVSMTHHVATVVLIVGSYLFRFGRICSIVVAIHDANDIFLELAKLSKYLNQEVSASVMFVCFAVSWVYLRLWCFPRFVIYSTACQVTSTLSKDDHPVDGPILYYTFNFLLVLLYVLHVYWWVLIARVLWKQITALGAIEKDVRSEDEDEDDD